MGRHGGNVFNRGSSIKIRLQRFGRRAKPFYRIVACHRWAPRDGKFLEILGTYNPIPDPFGNKQVTLKVDKVNRWMMYGAEPSETVAKLLGAAELIPPAPRRGLPKQMSLLELARDLPPLDADPDGDADSEGGPDGTGGTPAADDLGASGGDGSSSSSDGQQLQQG